MKNKISATSYTSREGILGTHVEWGLGLLLSLL